MQAQDRPRAADYGALLLRLTLGALFLAHLYWKFELLPGGFARWWASFAAGGYPSITPYYAFSAELAGALLLIPGILTRWVSLYAVPLMAGAAHFWLVRKGFYFTAGGAEMPAVWGVLLIIQALLGDGAWAVRAPAAGRRPVGDGSMPENSGGSTGGSPIKPR